MNFLLKSVSFLLISLFSAGSQVWWPCACLPACLPDLVPGEAEKNPSQFRTSISISKTQVDIVATPTQHSP